MQHPEYRVVRARKAVGNRGNREGVAASFGNTPGWGVSMTQPADAILQDFLLPGGALRVSRVRQVRRDSSRQVQEHCRRMLVGRNRLTKRYVAEVLQCVGKRVI